MADGTRSEWLLEGNNVDKEVVTHVISQILQEPLFRDDSPKFQKLLMSIMSITTKNLFQLMQPTRAQSGSPSKERRDHYLNLHLFLLLDYRILARTSKLLGKEF